MTKKELKNLARQIAHYEHIIQTTSDSNEKYNAEQMVMSLTNKVEDFDDMMRIDEMVLGFLEKNWFFKKNMV